MSLGKALPSLGLRLPSVQGRSREAPLWGSHSFGHSGLGRPGGLRPRVCLRQLRRGYGRIEGGLPSTPPCLRGRQSALLSPSPKAQYLELLLHQKRKNHYLQMTSLCKNASSGWLPSRAPGKGGVKKGLGARQPPAALASSNFMHLRITPDKFLNFSGLQSSHLYSERPDLGVARSPSCWESPRPCDSSSSSLRRPLGCRCTRESPTHTGAQGWGWKKRKVATLPNWATQRPRRPPKCLKTDSLPAGPGTGLTHQPNFFLGLEFGRTS